LNRKRLVLAALFSLILFALLPLSIWLDERFSAWYVFGVPLFILLLGYGMLWRYRLLFLVLVVVLFATGLLEKHGDVVIGMLLFFIPYTVACIAIAYRIAERLAPEEWVEPSYPEEPEASEEYRHVEPGRPRWNPYAGNEPVLLRRGGPSKPETGGRRRRTRAAATSS